MSTSNFSNVTDFYLNVLNATTEAGPVNDTLDFTTRLYLLQAYLSLYVLHLMHIPVIILILITLIGKESEHAKWFVFHTAILNLILGILWEVVYICNVCEAYLYITVTMEGVLNIAVLSIFPLAFSKFSSLYFPNVYEIIFKKKFLLLFFLVYDLFFLILYVLIFNFGLTIIILVIYLLNFFSTMFCSTLVFIKLKNLMKMIDSHSKLSTYSDLRRASYICVFQNLSISLHIFAAFYVTFYTKYFMYNADIAITDVWVFFTNLNVILAQFKFCIYQMFVIVDTTATLFVLRSYRNELKKVGRFLVRMITKPWDKKKMEVEVVRMGTRMNNFTKSNNY